MKKIVAIAGGEFGSATRPHELDAQIREIFRLTEKAAPKMLILPHAQRPEKQEECGERFVRRFEAFGFTCRVLTIQQLSDAALSREAVEWADAVFEVGGNTLDMIARWKETGFDAVLRRAWENGTVLSGISAGANCWFDGCSSDSLKIKYGPDQPLIGMDCLGFYPGFFVPHADEPGRADNIRDILRERGGVGLSFSNCAALILLDDDYRVLTSDASFHGITAYGRKTWWAGGEYHVEEIPTDGVLRPFRDLVRIPE